jgi:hypothetical protein
MQGGCEENVAELDPDEAADDDAFRRFVLEGILDQKTLQFLQADPKAFASMRIFSCSALPAGELITSCPAFGASARVCCGGRSRASRLLSRI